MIKNKSFALIIQGPIISSGNSGAGDMVKSYNCLQNIERYIQIFDEVIDFFIIATWKSSFINLPPTISSHKRIRFLYLDDPGPQKTFTNTMFTNDYRQAYGSFIGIQSAIELYNPDYLVKVRTDQFCDVKEICNHMLAVDSAHHDYQLVGQNGFIFLPNTLRWSPYSTGDFYIGGHSHDMSQFFEAQCKLKNHSFSNAFPWIHSDLILRHAYANLSDKLDLDKFYYFPNIAPSYRVDLFGKPKNFKYHTSVLNLWEELLRKSICIYPKTTALSLVWRGSGINQTQHTLGDFYDEWIKMREDVKHWYSTNMPNYYLRSKNLSNIQKYISFCHEKEIELKNEKPQNTFPVQLIRFFATIFAGQFPTNEWALNKWGKIQKKLKRIIH